jgi:hypothetical protein
MLSPAAAANQQTVAGPSISVRADWNQSRDATAVYVAPDGWHVESARYIVDSVGNNPSFTVDNRNSKVVFWARAQGSGKFYDQYGGWLSAHTEVIIAQNGK